MLTEFHQNNRQDLMRSLNGGVIVLSAYKRLQRRNDMAFLFDEQESNFWYLTGVNHPDWLLICDGSTGTEWLVAPTVAGVHELFDGSLTLDKAAEASGIKKIISSDEGSLLLKQLAKKHSVVYTIGVPPYADHFNFVCNPAIAANKKLLERTFSRVVDCQKDIAKLRAVKQPDEIKSMQKAVDITIGAFEHAKKQMSSLQYEHQLEAEFSYYFRHTYASVHAYDPIVASGKNACTLHYMENTAKIASKDLILIDVGASYGGYAADITRTYAKGEISKRKKAVHAAVVEAQQEIIAMIEPNLSVELYSAKVDQIMKRSLQSLGLLQDLNDEATYRRYFPHAISHGLGIDVHDSLAGARMFEPGMVLTVEPGIYIPEENIGVRIEDDILVTQKSHRNMSAKLSTDW